MTTTAPRIETARLVEHHPFGTFVQDYTYDRSIKVRRGAPHERRDRLQMTSQRLVCQLYGYPVDHAIGICAECTKRYARGDLGEDLPI